MAARVNRIEDYRKRIDDLEAVCSALRRKRERYGWVRLAVALSAMLAVWFTLPHLWVLIPFAGLFLFVVKKDLQNAETLRHTETLISVCDDELKVLSHDYLHRADGAVFLDPHHAFAEDLDLFGKASVFQFVQRTSSEQGSALLADWLQAPAPVVDIRARQLAVQELGQMPEWCQVLRACGITDPVGLSVQESTAAWLKEPRNYDGKPLWTILRFLAPACSLTWLGVYLADLIATPVFLSGLAVFIVLAFSISARILPVYNRLNRISPQLASLAQSIRHIESVSFGSPLLDDLRGQCFQHGQAASGRITQLRRILDRFDLRLNFVVHIPLNIFLLWDLQQVLSLERWQRENQVDTDAWFSVLANIEVLSSLGTLAYHHPRWVFPELADDESWLEAKAITHPLIPPAKAVTNDASLRGLALVTGSNMAGKSTFLRTIGVNLVLAGMGAPVCAEAFRCAPWPVMSSMRIRDNLEESTSTFYAELKKLKAIIDVVHRGDKVIILLDEILRGTNSQDRHTGSMALVRQLIRRGATGIVATHDLGLASLESAYPGQIRNMHFDVQVSDGEMYFDYRLKPGVCNSMNASLLMQKIGIRLDQ